ncbi:hypothetical protein FCL47_21350 [Desulfopila sp. IMCC35006]|nr:hypothetical protein FCL47_21350 [Desulfopila sp. IMCC35006]
MPREKSKWRLHEDESTNAEHRDGLPRSSDEASVMGVSEGGNMSKFTYWSTRDGKNRRVLQTLLNRGHEEPDESRDSSPDL